MIKKITMMPLNLNEEHLWFNDFSSNLHPVKFALERTTMYVDVRLYEKLCTEGTPVLLDQFMDGQIYEKFIQKLESMDEGDMAYGRCTLLVDGREDKMTYILNCCHLKGEKAITGVFYDVSVMEALRAQLVNMDNLIMLGQLSAGILHDVGNHIMTAGALATVIKEMTNDSGISQYADDISVCMEACGQLTSNSRGIAKSNIEKYVRVNVWNLMRRITNMLKGTFKDKYKMSIKTFSEYYYVLGDEYLLQNAILNVMLNARDAMPDGGHININISDNGEMLLVSIKDTGIGMDESIRSRIFEPFFTTKANTGTGIGLARCKSTIESHNGSIKVKSTPGEGSEFIISLPLLR